MTKEDFCCALTGSNTILSEGRSEPRTSLSAAAEAHDSCATCGLEELADAFPEHGLHAQTFLEADIQALKEAVQLTRHEAVQALKHTQGRVSRAFTNELAALDLHVSFVDGLVQNYAIQR